jgi:hypothetical protein
MNNLSNRRKQMEVTIKLNGSFKGDVDFSYRGGRTNSETYKSFNFKANNINETIDLDLAISEDQKIDFKKLMEAALSSFDK